MNNPRIYTLKRLIKLMIIVSLLWGVFVVMGFFESTDPASENDIRIPLPAMQTDNPYLVRYDNKQLIVVYIQKEQWQHFLPVTARVNLIWLLLPMAQSWDVHLK